MTDRQKPSIFNDVIGPVMRGPSSSHTAASHRIGALLRQFIKPENGNALVEFDRKGSLATTFEGQGSDMGLIAGLLGLSILDHDIIRFKEKARDKNVNIRFVITDFEAFHPNTYRITIENGETFRFVALSTGGGMVEITEVNEFSVSITGDSFETLLCIKSINEVESEKIISHLKQLFPKDKIFHYKGTDSNLINIKSESILPDLTSIPGLSTGIIKWIRSISPVLPVLSGQKRELPFSSADEMINLADEKGYDLAHLAILYESARAGIGEDNVISMMDAIVEMIKNSVNEGLKGTVYKDRILGFQSNLLDEAEKSRKIIPTLHNKMIRYVTAIMEAKSSMGIIVASPTAGSAGVVGGSILALSEELSSDSKEVTKAFLAAGMIGVFIADRYTYAAEEGGCQVECGAASGMAAAGLVQLMGGTAREAINAASMALQNILGLVCDPVADRVEVPCLGKNILGASNALNCANMSIAGYDHVIPFDEVLDAMKNVGESLPASLCCTGLGGLSVTPTAIKIQNNLRKNKT